MDNVFRTLNIIKLFPVITESFTGSSRTLIPLFFSMETEPFKRKTQRKTVQNLANRDVKISLLMEELKEEVYHVLPEQFHNEYREHIHPQALSEMLNRNVSWRASMDTLPLNHQKDPITPQGYREAIIIGIAQHFGWLISKYRKKVAWVNPKLLRAYVPFSDEDWIYASARHAVKCLELDYPFKKIQREFVQAARKAIPSPMLPQFDLACDLLGSVEGNWMVFDRSYLAAFYTQVENILYKYNKERALYNLTWGRMPIKDLSLNKYGYGQPDPNGNHPLNDPCLKEAIEEAVIRKDFKFFVQIGDTIRKPENPSIYSPQGYELQWFLALHWVVERDGFGPLCRLSITQLFDVCDKNLTGQSVDAVEKTRQRMGLITFRNGKLGDKNYINHW
jgi:hypothetical protein